MTKVICDTAVLHNKFFIWIIQEDTHGECGGDKILCDCKDHQGFFFSNRKLEASRQRYWMKFWGDVAERERNEHHALMLCLRQMLWVLQ